MTAVFTTGLLRPRSAGLWTVYNAHAILSRQKAVAAGNKNPPLTKLGGTGIIET